MTQFLSTPSARRATPKYHEKQYNRSDFYPRPLRGGRPVNNGCSETPQQISIHALCEEGDPRRRLLLPLCRNFYPRPLRGGRLDAGKATIMANLFLSTPSARRATIAEQADTIELLFLSTPSARRATRLPGGLGRVPNISIHALCEEGDVVVVVVGSVEMLFLSTPSARRATKSCTATTKSVTNFYPRPLRGGRPNGNTIYDGVEVFLSTPSARRATAEVAAPRSSRKDFYPRPLRGGRRDAPAPRPWLPMNFYPRPLRGGRLDNYLLKGVTNHDFYPRPLRGGRRIHTLLSPFE